MRKLLGPLLLALLGIVPAASPARCVYPTIRVSRVGGAVFDRMGAPISGADVNLKTDGQVFANTKTDESGGFFIAAPPGKYDLNVNTRGFAAGFARIDVGIDLVRALKPTHLWMTLSVGVSEVDECSSLTTRSQKEFDEAVQKYKQKH